MQRNNNLDENTLAKKVNCHDVNDYILLTALIGLLFFETVETEGIGIVSRKSKAYNPDEEVLRNGDAWWNLKPI